MEDVAARAGVSRALVSIVFRDAPGASASSRERVLAAAAQLGFRPDRRARLLGRTRTRLLGVVFGVQHPFHGDLVEAVYAAAEPAGYDVALSAVAPSRDETRAVEALLDYRCEALLLLAPTMPARRLADLAGRLPVVVVARGVRAAGVDVVRTDDTAGGRLAVQHLVDLGHRDLVHVDGAAAAGAAERRRGYRAAMRRAGLADSARLVRGGLTEDDGASAVAALLATAASAAGPGLPTALTVFNDRCAVGVLEALRAAGTAVPEQVSVVGYDDDRLARLSHVNLTTVRQDVEALAVAAVERALAHLDGDDEDAEIVVLPTLVRRGTTGPPRR